MLVRVIIKGVIANCHQINCVYTKIVFPMGEGTKGRWGKGYWGMTFYHKRSNKRPRGREIVNKSGGGDYYSIIDIQGVGAWKFGSGKVSFFYSSAGWHFISRHAPSCISNGAPLIRKGSFLGKKLDQKSTLRMSEVTFCFEKWTFSNNKVSENYICIFFSPHFWYGTFSSCLADQCIGLILSMAL